MNTNVSESEQLKGKKDNFYGDRSIVMPKGIIKSISKNDLINNLFITDIGYYPQAIHHYRKREKGLRENILIYCINGEGYVNVDGQSCLVSADSYFVIPANKAHSYWASQDIPWSIYWLHFGGKQSHQFEHFGGRVIPIKAGVGDRIDDRINLFNEILTALEFGFSKENIEFANLSLNRLLASFFYMQTYRASKGYQSRNPVDQSIFFMQKNLIKNIKIGDISNFVGLSESHLSKIFRNQTGTSPIDYFINLKMQEAIRLLTNKSLRVKEVAFNLGYNDPFYFSRLFKKHIGVSPGAFAKTIRRKSIDSIDH